MIKGYDMFSEGSERSLKRILIIGTRGSDLALWQARHIRDQLRHFGVESEYKIIKTQGDQINTLPFSELQGKGFFTKELEEALLAKQVDLAVHSFKDLATEMPEGLCIAAMVGREDPSELLLANKDAVDDSRLRSGELLPLRTGAQVGTSAARRQAQLRTLRPDLKIADLRGNVPTRIRKLREGQHDAVILASAGIQRLKPDISDLFVKALPVEEFVPAPAQGMLAVQCRSNDPFRGLLGRLQSSKAVPCIEAERRLLARLEGGCRLPFGVNVRIENGNYRLSAFWMGENRDALRIDLAGRDPFALADETFDRISIAVGGKVA